MTARTDRSDLGRYSPAYATGIPRGGSRVAEGDALSGVRSAFAIDQQKFNCVDSPHQCPLFKKIVKTRLAALKYSYDGIVACLRDELAFRLECVFAIPHFIMIFIVQMDVWMRVLLGVLWFILIAVELLNSGLEAIVDLASPEYHALAKKAKDCGSAAVFCVLMLIVGCWIIAIGGF